MLQNKTCQKSNIGLAGFTLLSTWKAGHGTVDKHGFTNARKHLLGSMVLMKNLSQNKYRRVINLISPPIEHDAYEANARNCEQISIVETSLVLPHSHFNQSNIFGYL